MPSYFSLRSAAKRVSHKLSPKKRALATLCASHKVILQEIMKGDPAEIIPDALLNKCKDVFRVCFKVNRLGAIGWLSNAFLNYPKLYEVAPVKTDAGDFYTIMNQLYKEYEDRM